MYAQMTYKVDNTNRGRCPSLVSPSTVLDREELGVVVTCLVVCAVHVGRSRDNRKAPHERRAFKVLEHLETGPTEMCTAHCLTVLPRCNFVDSRWYSNIHQAGPVALYNRSVARAQASLT